jgi:rhodanese-related sulfurtransferase
MIDHQALADWQHEEHERTLYILDVRSAEEFEAGHLKGSRNAPGGQLVQATDEYAVVQKARIVLVDDTEIRAVMSASWLIQMGWAHVYVLSGGLLNLPLVRGPHISAVRGFKRSDTIQPSELETWLQSTPEPALIDLASSAVYGQGHIPGAHWGIRSRLDKDLQKIPCREHLVLTSPDGVLAHLTAEDVKTFPGVLSAKVLEGGTRAWVEAGRPVTGGMERPISEVMDLYYKPYEHTDAPEAAMSGYLTWEVGLVDQVRRDGTAGFREFHHNAISRKSHRPEYSA